MSDLTGVDKLFHGAFCALSPQQLALSAFNFSILVGGWKSISYCGLICISLMSNVGSFLRAYWLFVYFLLQNICSGIWLFKIMLGSPLSLFCVVLRIFILDTNSLSITCPTTLYFAVCGLFFHF